MRSHWVLNATIVALLAGTIALGGCAADPEPEPPVAPPAEETAAPEPVQTTPMKAYFVRGEKIGVAGREADASDDVATVAKAAVEALVAGPTAEEIEFGLGTAVPAGTKVNGVTVSGDVATVDLSSEFQSGGGSLSMQLRVAQVVCTLTQFEGVERVAFQIDGAPAEAIGGEGVIVDPPVGRADFEDQLPPILVESPVPGEAVTSPLTVSGSSNVFEATHQLNVTDPDGLIIVDKFVTATSGTGTRGTWSETVEYGALKRDGLGAVIVFELSAKDGSQQNIVEIPVRMTK